MPFDSSTRGKLQKMVTNCKVTLTGEFTSQLQSVYGIQPTGEITGLASMTHLDDEQHTTASLLRERIDHLAGGKSSDKKAAREAIDRVIREQSFTVLNRLAALRMCEERGIVQECIRDGFQSRGFQVYCTTVGASLGAIYDRYRVFLQCVFDEISVDLGILFDRFSPFGLLFPREPALLEVFKVLNDSELKEVWKDDETIGWVYQYFNSKEEREAMRKASAAPRNSRELAVRNQFFTPRYVVEFLTDNTLGRIWYEMTKGETRLKEECRYLVRRPNEIFLAEWESAPQSDIQENDDNKTQEELLKEPVYISHRPIKDPREIRMLDPACGSMHFGLYAFDLFERIYEESWDEHPELMKDLRETCGSRDEFMKMVPQLILRHNIHGIEIDLHATQIAGLSLWLRAQRAYQNLVVKPAERPRITRANIVCAEPLPEDHDLLNELMNSFTGEYKIVAELVREVWEKMQLAGEAGSLLKIEHELKDAIDKAKKEWDRIQRGEPLDQFHIWKKERLPRQIEIHTALKQVKKGDIWGNIEEMVVLALMEFAERAGNGKGYRRKLFAEDTAQGFAFIDLCRKNYDVVLMNPPFGEPCAKVRGYLYSSYAYATIDLFASFVERFAQLADAVGTITSRTGFFLASFEKWRKEILYTSAPLTTCADLGDGVLDAMVEAAAYCLQRNPFHTPIFFRLIQDVTKADRLSDYINKTIRGIHSDKIFICNNESFSLISGSPCAYWVSSELRHKYHSLPTMRHEWGELVRGPEVNDLFREVRCWWEVALAGIGQEERWAWYAKGGEFKRFASDVHLLVDYQHVRQGLREFRRPGDSQFYFKAGITYTQRTTSPISFRALPKGCLTSPKGPAIIAHNGEKDLEALLAICNSTLFRSLIEVRVGAAGGAARSYDLGILRSLPMPHRQGNLIRTLSQLAKQAVTISQELTIDQENNIYFSLLPYIQNGLTSLKKIAELRRERRVNLSAALNHLLMDIDEQVAIAFAAKESGEVVQPPLETLDYEEELQHDAAISVISLAIGLMLGRWDIRIKSLAQNLPDPFELLPVCPPGMLIAPDGYPATPGRIVSEEWLRKRPSARLLPPPNSVSSLTITDEEYPLRVTWSGILVDDANTDKTQAHQEDIVRRLTEVLDIIFGAKAGTIEHESCQFLGVSSLQEYFRKPSGFFEDHLKRYSKSRRKAPIYWPLSSESGSYTLWIYYHRLTDQTLFQCVNDFVEPKIQSVTQDMEKLRAQVLQGGTAKQRDELEKFQSLHQELTDFRDELLRVAELPYQPNLNDGVLITASPLHKLFRLPKWRKDLEVCWKKLEAGEYDWAHLAYSIWPDRVREVCKKDKSIAIAHGLEELYEEPIKPKKTKRAKRTV